MSRIVSALLLLLLTPLALALTPLDAGTMEAQVIIANTVEFTSQGSDFRVDYAEGTLTWYPRDDWLQEVRSITTSPQAERDPDSFTFTWQMPSATERLELVSTVKTRNAIVPVRERIPFPLQDISPEAARYLGDERIADQSPEIARLAQEIADGRTDAYEVVFALADWTTTNVEYSLTSLGQPAIQRSSEVIVSREGKCDELTALFISLNRALGIPARFVAGYAYTNSDRFSSEWGGHGWAEVWFPETGWVPFDVTYGEYGYLDAGHVKLKTAPDAKETSIDYSARGVDFSLVTRPLDITVVPTTLTPRDESILRITLDTPVENAGFGSVVPILATVENTRDYYVSTRLDISQTTNTDLLSETYKNILLAPREKRTITFLVRISDDLKSGFAYEFPFHVTSRLGDDERIIILVREHAQEYDAEDFAELIDRYAEPEVVVPFTVACTQQAQVYGGQQATHTCVIDGAGASEVTVCDGACERIPVVGNSFTLMTDAEEGVRSDAFTARIGGEEGRFIVLTRGVGKITLVAEMQAPETTTPDGSFLVTAHLDHEGSLPKEVRITLEAPRASTEEERLADLSVPADLRFMFPGRALRPGMNQVFLKVTYVDELGTPGEFTQSVDVTLEGVTWLDHILFVMDDAGRWVMDLFS